VFRRSRHIRDTLTKTRKGFFGQIMGLLGTNEVTDELWENLEELLILADVGVNTTVELVERLQERVIKGHIRQADGVTALLKEELLAFLNGPMRSLATEKERMLTVVLIVGANVWHIVNRHSKIMIGSLPEPIAKRCHTALSWLEVRCALFGSFHSAYLYPVLDGGQYCGQSLAGF